jgi:hypothetical protein
MQNWTRREPARPVNIVHAPPAQTRAVGLMSPLSSEQDLSCLIRIIIPATTFLWIANVYSARWRGPLCNGVAISIGYCARFIKWPIDWNCFILGTCADAVSAQESRRGRKRVWPRYSFHAPDQHEHARSYQPHKHFVQTVKSVWYGYCQGWGCIFNMVVQLFSSCGRI